MAKLRRTNRKEAILRPVFPNIGLEVEYRRRLAKLVDEMNSSVVYWLSAAYNANEPEIVALAHDAKKPADELQKAVRKMRRQWLKNFDKSAEELAKWFSLSVSRRSDAVLKDILKRGGFSVKFQMTPAMKDVLGATVNANVSLIRTIPSKYFSDIEGMVMRSVQTGRDLKQLTDNLQKTYGVTRRRAILIAKDQNNKATSALNRARQLEVGIKRGIWMHSGAGKEPRPSHVKMNGKTFDIAKGMWDPDEKKWIMPGELINCRCSWRAVIPGFD